MTTPNTTGPSAEIQRFDPVLADAPHDGCCAEMAAHPDGRFVLHSAHLAALSRAREEARREALEEAAKAATPYHATKGGPDGCMRFCPSCRSIRNVRDAIRALLTPTPQGETKEQ